LYSIEAGCIDAEQMEIVKICS